MVRPKITLYVDTVSPFAYEAYYILRHDETFKECDITYVPVFLPGLFMKCSNQPPLKIKNKDVWINRERLRWARVFNIPISEPLPPDFPTSTIAIMRALCAIASSESESNSASNGDGAAQQPRLIKALDTFYEKYWVQRVATHQPEVLRATLEGLFGAEEAEKILTASTSDPIKQLLSANTDKAFSDGAFGLPWMVCTNADGQTESFWGVDHLGQVAQFLKLRRMGGEGWRAVL